MKEKQMEKYIWMYLDGKMSPHETSEFLREVQVNDKLREELEMAQKLESLLMAQPVAVMPEHLKTRITLNVLSTNVKSKKSSTWFGTDLKWFILMNLAILVLGWFFSWNYQSESNGNKWIDWSSYIEVLNKPYLRLFFLLCAGTFCLLITDYLLKAKWSGRYNYAE